MGDLPEKWQGERGIGKLHQQFNVGEYVPGDNAYDQTYEDVQVLDTKKDGVWTIQWQTPIGTLKQVRHYSPISFSFGYVERPVKTVDDLKILRFIAEHTRYKPNCNKVKKLDQDLGEYGLPVVAVPGAALGELYYHWAGITTLTYLFMDERKELEMTLEAIVESQNQAYEITAKSPCDYVMLIDNLSADTVGGFFSLYSKDYYIKRIDMLHSANKKVITHIDGKLRGLIEKLPQTGLDCLDAVTPEPVGDVALSELRQLVGDDIIICGGLPGAMFAPPFTAKDIEKQVMEIIRCHKKSGKFIVGVADQVPPNGDINFVKLVSELLEEYGRY